MSRNYQPQRMPRCNRHGRKMHRTQHGKIVIYRCPIDRCEEFALPPLERGGQARITQSARVAV
jgi:ribosomal protein L34